MKYIQGQNRAQTLLFPTSLEDAIETDNLVRVIDLFVDSIDLKGFGFKVSFTENGRPAYHPADVGFILAAYNLKRIINILGIQQFNSLLRNEIQLILANFRLLIQTLTLFYAVFINTRKFGYLEKKVPTMNHVNILELITPSF